MKLHLQLKNDKMSKKTPFMHILSTYFLIASVRLAERLYLRVFLSLRQRLKTRQSCIQTGKDDSDSSLKASSVHSLDVKLQTCFFLCLTCNSPKLRVTSTGVQKSPNQQLHQRAFIVSPRLQAGRPDAADWRLTATWTLRLWWAEETTDSCSFLSWVCSPCCFTSKM